MEKYQKIGVTGFLAKENKVLIVKRSDSETFLPGYYEMPGGKVDFGENPADAIEREFKEEVGLNVKAIRPVVLFSYMSDNGNRHTVDITYLLEMNDENGNVMLGSGHTDFKWITKEEINNYKISDNMKNCILAGFREI